MAADTHDEAVDMAKDALVTALEFYFDDRREIPEPSRVKKGQIGIELPASVAAKVLLLNEMVRQNVRPSELARRLGTSAQDVNRRSRDPGSEPDFAAKGVGRERPRSRNPDPTPPS